MAESAVLPEVKPMNAQQAQAYKDACDNLIYLKREQFRLRTTPGLCWQHFSFSRSRSRGIQRSS